MRDFLVNTLSVTRTDALIKSEHITVELFNQVGLLLIPRINHNHKGEHILAAVVWSYGGNCHGNTCVGKVVRKKGKGTELHLGVLLGDDALIYRHDRRA